MAKEQAPAGDLTGPPQSVAEIQDSGHIDLEIDLETDLKTEKHQPASSPKRRRGRPATHGLSGTPTEASFKSAKARCTNPRHAQFADYGGRGILFRLSSVADLVADIGERPEGTTLDRIDPNGHYEPGNLRWATAQEQGQNRRPPNYYKEKAVADRWHRQAQDRDLRRRTSRWWLQSVALFNDTITQAERSELHPLHEKHGIPLATFQLDEPRDWDKPGAGYIRLPSLTRPGDQVILRGGPFGDVSGSPHNGRGFVSGMANVPLGLNCTNCEIHIVEDLVTRKFNWSGVCFTGSQNWSEIPIEGRLMAIAARLAGRVLNVRLNTGYEIETALVMGDWEDLSEGWLVVPDLSCPHPGFSIPPHCRPPLLELLRDRTRNAAPTLIYVCDPIALGPELALFLEHQYLTVPLEQLPGRPQAKPAWYGSE